MKKLMFITLDEVNAAWAQRLAERRGVPLKVHSFLPAGVAPPMHWGPVIVDFDHLKAPEHRAAALGAAKSAFVYSYDEEVRKVLEKLGHRTFRTVDLAMRAALQEAAAPSWITKALDAIRAWGRRLFGDEGTAPETT